MKPYCESVFTTKRFRTREVMVGNVGIGGNNPIRIQSMTTSSTREIEATSLQIMQLADYGCEIVRVTVQGIKEAEACEGIKNTLLQKGYTIPLVADIHFFPPAAMKAVEFVDKVRINPGNYVDKRASFKTIEYDDVSYLQELERIEEKFTPLVEKCKNLKKALRIGTNHGSLSDRIMNRFGDSPLGMVESALEFARICRKNDFHHFVFSMKASNPKVMIEAYRLLVAEMLFLGWDYPLHLGVTEAGEGEDGRIKSAMGIGSLLVDGIGDTIRVSLTEDAWKEIDPCKKLISFAERQQGKGVASFQEKHREIANLEKRKISFPEKQNFHRDGAVFLTLKEEHIELPSLYEQLGCEGQFNFPKLKNTSVDALVLKGPFSTQKSLLELSKIGVTFFSSDKHNSLAFPLLNLKEAKEKQALEKHQDQFGFLNLVKSAFGLKIEGEEKKEWEAIFHLKPSFIVLSLKDNRVHYARHFFDWMKSHALELPVILNFSYACSKEELLIEAAAEYGALFCDNLGEGIWIEGPYDIEFLRNLSFNILQASRMRSSKTDFISCPSCGRTLFDLQEVSKRIREKTAHLPGVKIAIMGCIVNGPGEMADADFGYVGSKPEKIDLYVGKTCVEKDISYEEADDRLIELIKKHNRWVEQPVLV